MSVENGIALSTKVRRVQAPIMSQVRRRSLACGVIVSFFVAPVHAESISGTFSGGATLTSTATPTIFDYSFSGNGVDPIHGAFDLTDQATLDISALPDVSTSISSFTVTSSTGSLFGAGSGTGALVSPGDQFLSTFELVVAGGTGGFAGYKGEITVTQTDVYTSATTFSVSGSYIGQVAAVPELSSWVLMLAGFAGLAFTGYRRDMYRMATA